MSKRYTDYELAQRHFAVLLEVDPVFASSAFGDDFEFGSEDGPGTGGTWLEVLEELRGALTKEEREKMQRDEATRG